MVKMNVHHFITIAFLIIMHTLSFSQENQPRMNTDGLFKVNLGLSQGFLYHNACRPLFAEGYAEYYTGNRFSIKGSFTQYITDRNSNDMFQNFSGLSFGGAIHSNHHSRSISDFSIGIQPGLAWVNLSSTFVRNDPSPSLIPTLTISANYTLFFSRLCNFYFTIAHQTAFHRGTSNGSINLSGISITGGLGFHISPKQ